MRPPSVVARVALIAALAMVAVPGSAGSQPPGAIRPLDESIFQPIDASVLTAGRVTAASTFDPAYRSDGALDPAAELTEPAVAPEVGSRAALNQPDPRAGVIVIPTWKHDPEISWYGPGFYGSGTACGQKYSKTIMGVAHRSLPCGTMVSFRYRGNVVTVPVIDRGPYVRGRQWDLSRAACEALQHCFTGPIEWKFP